MDFTNLNVDDTYKQEIMDIINWYKHKNRRRELYNTVIYYIIRPIYILARWITG